MPVFLFCRDVHDIAHADDLLVRLGSDDALSGSDKQHLIAAMDVHFVPCTNTEIDDGKIKVVAHLRRQQRLSRHGTAREQGTICWFRGNRVGFEYFHSSILLPDSGSSLSATFDSHYTHSSVSISRGGENFQPDEKVKGEVDIMLAYRIGSAH